MDLEKVRRRGLIGVYFIVLIILTSFCFGLLFIALEIKAYDTPTIIGESNNLELKYSAQIPIMILQSIPLSIGILYINLHTKNNKWVYIVSIVILVIIAIAISLILYMNSLELCENVCKTVKSCSIDIDYISFRSMCTCSKF